MNIILDNIIFTLQNSGGISVYWHHHIKRLQENRDYVLKFIEEHPTNGNLFRGFLNLAQDHFIPVKKVPMVGRYLNLNLDHHPEKAIFHSSYYRVSKNPNHVNVTTVHDFTYEHFSTGIKRFVHSAQKKNAILNSHGIICISENTKEDLLRFVPEAADKQIRVIHNGVDDAIFNSETAMTDKLPYDVNTYILYVGNRSAKYKNFEIAVKTAALVDKPLVMVGGGPLGEKDLLILDGSLPKSQYRHLGEITVKALNRAYNNAFCLLYPSSYEGFGIPPIEAQKAGCPVVAYRASSLPEIVGDGGILVDESNPEAFANAIRQLEDLQLRTDLINKGMENAKNYCWENTYKETTDFYRELLESNK
ncbi:MAG: glycosyltransferase family 1 protein [Sediminicola sp.]